MDTSEDLLRLFPSGITKDGRWYLYDGPVEKIVTGEWEDYAVRGLGGKTRKNDSFSVVGAGGRSLKDIIDFALPVVARYRTARTESFRDFSRWRISLTAAAESTASAAAMDKIISKELFIRAGIPACPYVPAAAEELEEDLDGVVLRIERELGYPVV